MKKNSALTHTICTAVINQVSPSRREIKFLRSSRSLSGKSLWINDITRANTLDLNIRNAFMMNVPNNFVSSPETAQDISPASGTHKNHLPMPSGEEVVNA